MNKNSQKYLVAFGDNLKRLIEKKEMKPQDVAALGYIETKQVYRVINAEHSASISTIVSIARGLDLHPKQLFDFDFDFDYTFKED